jgi:hypothetical protein
MRKKKKKRRFWFQVMHVLGLYYVMGTLEKTQNLNNRTQSVGGHNHTHFRWETGQLGKKKKEAVFL